ncbi:MAG: sulfatase-like hydrolase/transferase [Moraxella sp.]
MINAFDNALLATDDFLAKTVNWLGLNGLAPQVAMLYVIDHGESLGETASIYMVCLIKSHLKARKNTSHRCFGRMALRHSSSAI